MSGGQRRGRKLNIARELFLVEGSVEALRLAAERKVNSSSPSSEFARTMVGGLHVLRDRLRLIERILMGMQNPGTILCPANEADASEDVGPGVIEEWSDAEEVKRLEAEWRGARYRQDLAKQAAVVNAPAAQCKKPGDGKVN